MKHHLDSTKYHKYYNLYMLKTDIFTWIIFFFKISFVYLRGKERERVWAHKWVEQG